MVWEKETKISLLQGCSLSTSYSPDTVECKQVTMERNEQTPLFVENKQDL